ncbi:MAG: hypothetical protein UV63_C0061G0008 [Microgenomates group bacterium GW2011_GWC1_43_11]|uniref:DUF541 domain-containing protein n=2 Tax=Candidatus Gottesmaniibacteriota TaxID=1752720 RepID=A0A0G1IH14_9BACT|nr:MAG: hypothetical protein UV63_C0061G0008 [Microgenomates group bacterium GW2011_GWC1_43_11]KKT36264.1 MAG: hypothetical protein UW22_C0041G0007 [Candidatus Gottesmanbacteria bacterium GW2011_GWB1_44_11c]KKT58123.1 MAG: hypothetical protein UW52_C0064G0006 [Candidatus Gottesmanbacteria bacterium GW2011_GWA1_44_24b]HCM82801.1 hypothetical protein [Patescibacteria group bacterium]
MNPKRLIQYLLSASIILLALVIIGAFFLPWRFINWGTFALSTSSTVTVVGEAQTEEENKRASFTAAVTIVKDKKEQAIDETNQKIATITSAVKNFGIPASDVKTQNLSIYQEEETYTERGSQKRRPGAWRVSNSIEITLRDAKKAGALADILSKTGATSVYGPNFTLDEESASGRALLSSAVGDARKKADLLAKAAGKKLGPIITISEGTTQQGPMALLRGEGMGGGSDMQPGSETIRKSVTVTFKLRDVFRFELPKWK